MTKYLLVKFKRDWADEFDMEGFSALTETEWNEQKEHMLSLSSISVSFGTNEGWEDEEPEDFLSSYKATEITLEQYNVLKELFPTGFGLFYDKDDFDDFD